MSHAPVAQKVANEANEQGSVTPKAAGDLCEFERRSAASKGIKGKGRALPCIVDSCLQVDVIALWGGQESLFDAMPQLFVKSKKRFFTESCGRISKRRARQDSE